MKVTLPTKLGVDTGGTFTDFILQTGQEFKRYKCPSTPSDPSQAILQGVQYFFPDGPPAHLSIIHGTTVGTNAFLERKGGRTLLITTKGFEDILAIGRQNRALLFDIEVTRPIPIIEDHLIIGIKERIDASGHVVVPLATADLLEVAKVVTRYSVETIVICFLNSFLNDNHERQAQKILAELAIPVQCSVDILPEFREFERCSTALVNGYLAPIMSTYIDRLTQQLGGLKLSVQQSNGGIMAASAVDQRAAHTLLSGPAAGVQGAYHLAKSKGNDRFITFDMGGTSTDVFLSDGKLSHTKEYVLDGYPISIPMLDIHTVGAGGGSIAYIDHGGALQVGPESAGANPGPVCYGVGSKITVTDANLLLGRLVSDSFLSGRIELDFNRAMKYAGKMAGELGVSVEELCLGIISIVNAGMVKAVRAVSLDRGYDPSDFCLYSFGGSSGLHCCELAHELGISTIEIPARAGVLSAQGLVFAPPLLDATLSLFLQGAECTYENVKKSADQQESEVRLNLLEMASADGVVCESYVDLRYVGQSYEITIPVNVDMIKRFHEKHKQLFGYDLINVDLECVSLRSVAKGDVVNQQIPLVLGETESCLGKMISVVLSNGSQKIPMYERERLPIQKKIWGPCLIIDDYTTILVTSLFSCNVDMQGTLVLQKENEI